MVGIVHVDYGSTDVLEAQHLRTLAVNFVQLPAQAIKCHLSGVRGPPTPHPYLHIPIHTPIHMPHVNFVQLPPQASATSAGHAVLRSWNRSLLLP